MFQVPSDPPSTPDSRRSSTNLLSTTPLGPPPSNTKHFSFTPSKPPQSTGLENSPFVASNSKQSFNGLPGSRQNGFTSKLREQSPTAWPNSRGKGSATLPSSPPRAGLFDDDENMDSLVGISPGIGSLKAPFNGSGTKDAPRVAKRQRLDESAISMKSSVRRSDKIDVLGFARGIAAASPPLVLNETDQLIVGTENIVDTLDAAEENALDAQANTTFAAGELLKFWDRLHPLTRDEVENEDIGPGPNHPPSASAQFLASLLIPLHHPSTWKSKPSQKARFSQSMVLHCSQGGRTIPEALLGWLNTYHDPGADMVRSMLRHRDNGYAAAPEFMDGIVTCLLRGQLNRVMTLLVESNYRGQDMGHTGPQLNYIEEAVETMAALLESCPAVESEDWDVKGSQWTLFRRRIEQTKSELRRLLEGDDQNENIGRSQLKFSLSRSSRRVESCLPQDIYDLFTDMCDIMLGDPEPIIKSSLDWVEAVFGLTIWWDGEEAENLQASTRGRGGARSRQSRPVDVTPTLAYRQRLAQSFLMVLEEEDLLETIDRSNPIHIGLCAIFEGDLEAFMAIAKHLSITISSAVAEIASVGGWLSGYGRRDRAFDKSDLMVLSYGGPHSETVLKDNLLATYADLLAQREFFYDEESHRRVEGWQLALTVLGRLYDPELATSKATVLLDSIALDSNSTVDKVLEICGMLGFSEQAMAVTERYADHLTKSRQNYGDAFLYYAKAHKPNKLKAVLHDLITLCVVQSRAYPLKSQLDDRLKSFLGSPNQAVSYLNSADLEAGRYLSTYLSGYATIRRFYDLRDEAIDAKPGAAKPRRPLANKQLAASALIAVISSAADSIRGGLLDQEVDVVVPVDNLLVLLGESLAFVNQPARILTLSQITTLLKAVEDLETVNPHVFSRCASTFQTALTIGNGSSLPSPNSLLKKSISNLTTASSQFSLVGSSMLDSREGLQGTSSDGSAVLVQGPIKRGWDWRVGLKGDTEPSTVLRILRLGIGKELAKVWIATEDERE